eukprot:1502153-Amphidinium_carterae.1
MLARGAVFERSTLLRYFQQHGPICPHTGHPLRIEDMLDARSYPPFQYAVHLDYMTELYMHGCHQ